MAHREKTWDARDLSQAMFNAISQCANNRFLRQRGDTVKFNGFWRDGDKQNICAWLDKATWHDAKTGEGGGCKEFAKVAFNMNLPEFMEKYGQRSHVFNISIPSSNSANTKTANALAVGYVNHIWRELCLREQNKTDHAGHWLEHKRGMKNPRSSISSGFVNLFHEDLELFDKSHHGLIKNRLLLGPNLIAPIRGTQSDKVENLFFRAINPVAKDQKSRLLTGAGGFGVTENYPRAFGFPHLIRDFPNLILCEGMADYFALECLLHGEERYLPVGVSNASALSRWAKWLVMSKYKGRVIIIYQLDINDKGEIVASATGQQNAIEALKILKTAQISSELFRWPYFLKKIPNLQKIPEDIAEVYSTAPETRDLLAKIFIQEITC